MKHRFPRKSISSTLNTWLALARSEVQKFGTSSGEGAETEQVFEQCANRKITEMSVEWLNNQRAELSTFTQQLMDQFDVVIWRSLQQAPPILNLLIELIDTFEVKRDPRKVATFPLQSDELIRQLLEQLRTARCLLIFDQVEAVLSSGELAGSYQSEDYQRLFDHFGQAQHQSSILLTSREIPTNIRTLAGATTPV